MTIVPNRLPTLQSDKRLALIGEAPGKDEEHFGRPFIGASGRFLAALLSRAGMSIDSCFLGNICQHRPPSNDISSFPWHGLEIQHGLEKLREDLEKFKPNIAVLLGNYPLKAAKGPFDTPKVFYKNSQWRGSLFQANSGSVFDGLKCMATYHPAYVLRDYEAAPMLGFDLQKAVRQAAFPELRLPQRTLVTDFIAPQIIGALMDIRTAKKKVALDIEGYIDAMSCISFATSPTEAFIVPFIKSDGSSYWLPHEEQAIWRALTAVLEDPEVPKVLQNSLYDRFVLHYSYGIRVQGVTDDTMLQHWELYSELEKSLGVQASLYTDEPYYKQERKSNDDKTFYEYCCKDSAVTLEINNRLTQTLTGTSLTHYKMNVAMLNPLLYMELRGIPYNVFAAAERRALLRKKMFEVQADLNTITGYGFSWKSIAEIQSRAITLMWTKKGDRVRKEYSDLWPRVNTLLATPSPDLATIGELEDLCEVSLNINSNKQTIPYLYETLKLPTQFTEKRNEEPRPTADYEALLKLSRWLIKETQQGRDDPRYRVIQAFVELRALDTRQGMLGIDADKDGRIRCGYNIVGSNTGRITCYESPTGSGYNLQTIPNYTDQQSAPGGVLGDRDLFLADPGFHFFQCDLSGADGWTVAAYSAMLGDPTMLLDYRAGISPFKILALKVLGKEVSQDRREIAEQVKAVPKDSWERFACKRVQHGGCYLEGAITISRNILKDSEGKLYMSPKECDQMKTFFFDRYRGVKLWHDWVASRLKARPVLQAASGQVRQFFGRTDEILTKAVAFEPQANTTYATNLAMYNLWSDKDNRNWTERNQTDNLRTRTCELRIEPLHQVHDALCGQFRQEDTAWAINKIKSYFDNPLKIAGQDITIPFEGGYGPSWGHLPNKI